MYWDVCVRLHMCLLTCSFCQVTTRESVALLSDMMRGSPTGMTLPANTNSGETSRGADTLTVLLQGCKQVKSNTTTIHMGKMYNTHYLKHCSIYVHTMNTTSIEYTINSLSTHEIATESNSKTTICFIVL